MHRLFKAEVKKTFFSPLVFVMAIILLLTLTILPKFFTPNERTPLVTVEGSTVSEVYADYTSQKAIKNAEILNIKAELNQLLHNDMGNFGQDIKSLAQTVDNNLTAFQTAVTNGEVSGENGTIKAHQNLLLSTTNLQQKYNEYMSEHIVPLLLVTEQVNYEITWNLVQLKSILQDTTLLSTNTISEFRAVLNAINNLKIKANLSGAIEKLDGLSYTTTAIQKILNDLSSKDGDIATTENKLTSIYNQVRSTDLDGNLQNVATAKNYALLNLSHMENLTVRATNDLVLAMQRHKTDGEMCGFVGFENFNSYKMREKSTTANYYLEHNLTEKDLSAPLSFGMTSGTQTNFTDYMFFAMQISSIVTILLVLILGACTVAQEKSSGTLSLMLVRPYSRSKILLAKILSVLCFGFIFTLASLILSAITGIIIYGFSVTPMLLTFNGTTSFVTSNVVAILIFTASLLLKILLYTTLAVMFSVIFRSVVPAICVACGVFIGDGILSFVLKSSPITRFLPLSNIDLFKYFGGSFLNTYGANNLFNLFVAPVFQDYNFYLSFGILLGIIALSSIVSHLVFRRKDIK